MSKPIATAGVVVGVGLIGWSLAPEAPLPFVGGITAALALAGALVEFYFDRRAVVAAVPQVPSPVAAAPPEAPSVPPSEITPPPDSRITLGSNVTPSFLMKLCEGKTEIQADSAVAPYIGKWLRVGGSIIQASTILGRASVSIKPRETTGFEQIYLIFKGDRERIAVLQKGDSMSAIGQINKIGEDEITLSECELLP